MRISTLANSIHSSPTLSLSAKARAMKSRGIDVIALSAGELDFAPPQVVVDAAEKSIEAGVIKYTAAIGMPKLRESIAKRYSKKYGVSLAAENIAVTVGAKQALANTLLALIEPGDEVIIPVPYWVSYPEMVRLSRGKPVFVPTSRDSKFHLDPAVFEKAISDRTKILMLNSPTNPTGAVYSKSELSDIFEVAKRNDIIVLADEIYEDLILDGEFFSFLQFDENIFDNVVVVSGVSKTFAMTGWRIGWAIADPNLISALGRIQGHQTSNPCTISQYAALAALEKATDFAPKIVEEIRARRDIAIEMLAEISGFKPIRPAGAFYIFCDIRDAIEGKFSSSAEFSEFLLEKALVAAVPGEGFGIDGYLRISIAASRENIVEAITRIKNVL